MTDINTLRSAIASNVASRLASDKAQSMTAANRKKLSDFSDVVSRNDAIATLLVACNYDASQVLDNVYCVKKVDEIARDATSEKINFASIYCNALVSSIVALEKAKIEVTREVVASLCSVDIKTKYDAKIKNTRVQSAKGNSTVATQHNSTVNAFLALSMLHTSRNANNDETFTLNRENEAVKAMCAKRDIKLSEEASA